MRRASSVEWKKASDIQIRVLKLIKSLDLNWINPKYVYCFRSLNSRSHAYARIWGLSKVWQLALSKEPGYIIEVLSEKFDDLGKYEQDEVLLHELAHIPKNFSGSLLPHIRKKGKRNFHDRVDRLVNQYKKVRI